MTLHLIQKSPFATSALKDCLNIIEQDDMILLMLDGVYACQSPVIDSIQNQMFALQDDLDARGIQIHKANIKGINYEDFVTLCTQCKNTISWY